MNSVIVEKATVEEAVSQALIELKSEKSDVEVEVIKEPSKGLLSFLGNKLAKVKVTVTNGP